MQAFAEILLSIGFLILSVGLSISLVGVAMSIIIFVTPPKIPTEVTEKIDNIKKHLETLSKAVSNMLVTDAEKMLEHDYRDFSESEN